MTGPAVIVRDAGDLSRALSRAAAGPLVILTAPGLARAAGPSFVKAMTQPAADRPDTLVVIDCDDDPGLALLALRCGWRHLLLDGPLVSGIASAAEQSGATVHGREAFSVT